MRSREQLSRLPSNGISHGQHSSSVVADGAVPNGVGTYGGSRAVVGLPPKEIIHFEAQVPFRSQPMENYLSHHDQSGSNMPQYLIAAQGLTQATSSCLPAHPSQLHTAHDVDRAQEVQALVFGMADRHINDGGAPTINRRVASASTWSIFNKE
jgi:hypothetical protein